MIRRRIWTPFLAIALSAAMVVTACNTSWISTALADLPVLVQIAENIAAIVAATQGQSGNTQIATQIQAVAVTAKTGLLAIQALVNSYNSYPAHWEYVPGNASTDNGFVIADFLDLWKSDAYGGVLLDGFVDVDPGNQEHFKQGIALFGGVDIGLQLPVAWQNMYTWDVVEGNEGAPGSWGGHSVWVPAYNALGPVCVTWGVLKQITWPALVRYSDEAHAIISPAWMDRNGRTTCGLAYTALRVDSEAIE